MFYKAQANTLFGRKKRSKLVKSINIRSHCSIFYLQLSYKLSLEVNTLLTETKDSTNNALIDALRSTNANETEGDALIESIDIVISKL